jgi:putative holliday junction resolvase
MERMRYLGVDYGAKRIGLAVSDESGVLAFPRGIVAGVREIERLVKKEGVEKVIVGLPKSLDGSETEQTRETRTFAEVLKKKIAIPVEFENEILTTRLVEKQGVGKAHVDESAAAVILQAYLDRVK